MCINMYKREMKISPIFLSHIVLSNFISCKKTAKLSVDMLLFFVVVVLVFQVFFVRINLALMFKGGEER